MAAEPWVAWCRVCDVVRYKSIRDLEKGGKPVTAADFIAVGDQPAPADGTPTNCYHCGKPLVFMPEANIKPKAAPTRPPERPSAQELINRAKAVVQESQANQVAVGQPGGVKVKTLFELGTDEMFITSSQLDPHHLVLVTTKRIVQLEV